MTRILVDNAKQTKTIHSTSHSKQIKTTRSTQNGNSRTHVRNLLYIDADGIQKYKITSVYLIHVSKNRILSYEYTKNRKSILI